MGVFATGLAYRGGKDEGWSYDEWLWFGRCVGLGVWEGGALGGVVYVWCRDSVGKAVLLHISPRNPHTTPSFPHLPHKPDPTFTI